VEKASLNEFLRKMKLNVDTFNVSQQSFHMRHFTQI